MHGASHLDNGQLRKAILEQSWDGVLDFLPTDGDLYHPGYATLTGEAPVDEIPDEIKNRLDMVDGATLSDRVNLVIGRKVVKMGGDHRYLADSGDDALVVSVVRQGGVEFRDQTSRSITGKWLTAVYTLTPTEVLAAEPGDDLPTVVRLDVGDETEVVRAIYSSGTYFKDVLESAPMDPESGEHDPEMMDALTSDRSIAIAYGDDSDTRAQAQNEHTVNQDMSTLATELQPLTGEEILALTGLVRLVRPTMSF